MKAAILQHRGRDGLVVRDVANPVRKPGEALVRIRAAALNHVDLYIRDVGIGIKHTLPMIMGTEGAGEVVEVAPESALAVGTKVILNTAFYCGHCRFCLAGDQALCEMQNNAGEHRDGTFAQYISLPERCIFPLPESADLAECAVIRCAHLTAWRMLFGKGALQPGETVLIVGIGGGVAIACLQLARITGAQVIVTSSSDVKLARAAELGAMAGINYRTEEVAKRVLKITAGLGVDMVIDTVGEATWGDSLRSLRRGGRLVTCGATTGPNPSADLQRIFMRQLQIIGSTGGSVTEFQSMLNLYLSGGFRPEIDKRYPLHDIDAALDYLQRGEQFGKIAIMID